MPAIALIPSILAAALAAALVAGTVAAPAHANLYCARILNIPDFDDVLTREERIALLECIEAKGGGFGFGIGGDGAVGAGNGNGNNSLANPSDGTNDNDGDPANNSGNPASSQSTPSTDIQGEAQPTTPPVTSNPANNISGDQPEIKNAQPGIAALHNGKLPEDIPPAANDDIIARQFRQAALEATNPVERARLWNEYRRYKNLPEQEVPPN